MRRLRWCLVAVVCGAGLLRAQVPQDTAFESASVKPNDSGDVASRVSVSGPQFTAINVSVAEVLALAFQLRPNDERLVGLPDWARRARFDIVAKAPAGVVLTRPSLMAPDSEAPSVITTMVRHLLEDRFRLKTHTETRHLSAYVLVLARPNRKLGPQLLPCSSLSDPARCGVHTQGMQLNGVGTTMAQFASMLSFLVQSPVVDQTELDGAYDITLDYAPDRSLIPPGAPASSTAEGPSLFTALEEQLGLKLEATKPDVTVLVVDFLERPGPN